MNNSSQLSAAELAQIQTRCDRTSPGPWTSIIEGRDQTSGSSFIMTAGEDIDPLGMPQDDQDFAAHARQDVPHLVAEVRRLSRGEPPGVDAAELAEVQSRCDRASAGPWRLSSRGGKYRVPTNAITTAGGHEFELRGVTGDDHAFIAHARQDLPRLVAEARRLRRKLGLA